MLKLGDKNRDVKQLKDWLVSINLLDKSDYTFDAKTQDAVKQVQNILGYEQTGIYSTNLKSVYTLKERESRVQVLARTSQRPKAPEEDVGESLNSNSQASFDETVVKQVQSVPCYVVNLLTNDKFGAGVIYLPHLPEEFSYSKGNTFDETATKGRSAPFYSYSGSTALTVDVSVTISADYCENNDIEKVLAKIEALAYPRYGNTVVPPKSFFRCGSFSVEGILTDVSITRKLPIINGSYSLADVSFNFVETQPKARNAMDVQSNPRRWK